jgi:hypothetical protein
MNEIRKMQLAIVFAAAALAFATQMGRADGHWKMTTDIPIPVPPEPVAH